MKAKRLFALLLTGAITGTVLLGGCAATVRGNVPDESSGSEEGTASESASQKPAQASEDPNALKLPENGGFGSVSYKPSEDKYRTYYEIFPYSFYDSDGDGIGDLKGIIHKLDYLNDGNPETTDDLGVEGIWLMPVMPSPSYHKYNITNYKDIDPAYGTLDDFKELLEEAHKRNIDVIIDLVINHTSASHEWYKNAIRELKEGKTDGYAQYYHFSKEAEGTGWRTSKAPDWYYECEFDSDMPDLNLTNETVRKEIESIVDFWLDIGVDGFRLDAVMWYESTGNKDSIADLKWLYDYAKSKKEDVYMVGECWSDGITISKFYESGADSFFNFDDQGASGKVYSAVKTSNAQKYVEYLQSWQETITGLNPAAIDAPFLSNHDTARSAGFIMTNTGKRLAASLYLLSPGNSFIYYGEEIGMTGSQTDPDKRTGMYWSSTDQTGYVKQVSNATNTAVPDKSVEEQLADEDSLLTFYKKVIALKNQNPEIARGKLKALDLGQTGAAGYVTEYNGSKVLVIFNLSDQNTTIEVPASDFTISEVRGYLLCEAEEADTGRAPSVDDILGGLTSAEEGSASAADSDKKEMAVSGQTVTMPASSVIILK